MTQSHRTPKGVLKKIINDPFEAVDEMLDGFVAAHEDIVNLGAPRVVVRRTPSPPKVGIVIGGGSGHEPAMAGYVGLGMADAAAAGNIFAAPSADICLEAIRLASSGRGVLIVCLNYSGDILNFGLATQLAEMEKIETRTVLVTDDVASAPRTEIDKRRGIAGAIHVFKCAGAMAERGAPIDEVERIAIKANRATRSMGVGLSSCEVPGSGRLTFDLGPDEIEIGLGIHGEPGMRRGPIMSADEIGAVLVQTILADLSTTDGHDVALLVNGLGATPRLDQYILYRAARRELEQAGNVVSRSLVGEYVTSQEMTGASVTVTVLDDELRELLDAPARTPGFIN